MRVNTRAHACACARRGPPGGRAWSRARDTEGCARGTRTPEVKREAWGAAVPKGISRGRFPGEDGSLEPPPPLQTHHQLRLGKDGSCPQAGPGAPHPHWSLRDAGRWGAGPSLPQSSPSGPHGFSGSAALSSERVRPLHLWHTLARPHPSGASTAPPRPLQGGGCPGQRCSRIRGFPWSVTQTSNYDSRM